MIGKAFILAAGFGTRMRPLTETMPKPLLEVGGRSLLERGLDQLEEAGVTDVVVNTHYRGGQIAKQLETRQTPRIHISHEAEILDTGGGIKNALHHFDNDAFYVLSGDGFWDDAPGRSALSDLTAAWDPDKMDILMLLQPVRTMRLTRGVGDYTLDKQGHARRSHTQDGAYMFTSMRINHPRIFKHAPNSPFSYLDLLDSAEKAGRLYGLINRGDWHHLSQPEDLEAVEAALRKRKSA